MTFITWLLDKIGFAGIVFLGMLVFYEGVPLVSSVPYIGKIPIIGELAIGRVQSEADKAAEAAREGYVLLAEKAAAEAKAAELERQRNAESTALEELRKRKAAEDAAEQQKEEAREREIRDYEIRLDQAQRACRIDDADIEFLRKP